MPVNDLGYRTWNGVITSPYMRWMTIAMSGIRIVFKSQWIKRLMFVAWAPALAVGAMFFFYEQYVENRDSVDIATGGDSGFRQVAGVLRMFSSESQAKIVLDAMAKEPNEARGYVWKFILMRMLRGYSGWMVLMLVGLITPPLISKDIRSRAFLFYFSKPITRTDYLLGKLCTVGFFVGFVTILPALALYLFGVVLSPSVFVLLSTWDLPFRVVAACLIVIVPSCLLGLMLSSLTSESRFAGFAWFTVWILGFVGYRIVLFSTQLGSSNLNTEASDSMWQAVSLYDCLGFLQAWIMGLETNHSFAIKLLVFVLSLSAFCVYVIMRKISAPINA